MESTTNDDRTSRAIVFISRITRERQDKIFPSPPSSSSDDILDRAAHRAAESICDRSLDPSPAGASRIMDEVAQETLLVEDGRSRPALETAARARRLGSSVAMALLSEAAAGSAASDLAGFIWVPEPVAMRGPAEGDGDGEGEEGGDVSMNDVREYCEEYPVQLSTRASSYFSPNALGPGHPGGQVAIKDGPRWVVRGRNEGGHNATEIDLVDLLRWLSAHRGGMLASLGIVLGERDRIARDVLAEVAWVLGAEFDSSGCYEPEPVEAADVERITRSVTDGVMRRLASPGPPLVDLTRQTQGEP